MWGERYTPAHLDLWVYITCFHLVKRKSFPNRTLDHNIDAILTELARWGEEMVELGTKEEWDEAAAGVS